MSVSLKCPVAVTLEELKKFEQTLNKIKRLGFQVFSKKISTRGHHDLVFLDYSDKNQTLIFKYEVGYGLDIQICSFEIPAKLLNYNEEQLDKFLETWERK